MAGDVAVLSEPQHSANDIVVSPDNPVAFMSMFTETVIREVTIISVVLVPCVATRIA